MAQARAVLERAQDANLVRLRDRHMAAWRPANDNQANPVQPTSLVPARFRLERMRDHHQSPTNLRSLIALQRLERRQLLAMQSATYGAMHHRRPAAGNAAALARSEIRVAFAARWAGRLPPALRAAAAAALKLEEAAALSARLAYHAARLRAADRAARSALRSVQLAERRALLFRHRMARLAAARLRRPWRSPRLVPPRGRLRLFDWFARASRRGTTSRRLPSMWPWSAKPAAPRDPWLPRGKLMLHPQQRRRVRLRLAQGCKRCACPFCALASPLQQLCQIKHDTNQQIACPHRLALVCHLVPLPPHAARPAHWTPHCASQRAWSSCGGPHLDIRDPRPFAVDAGFDKLVGVPPPPTERGGAGSGLYEVRPVKPPTIMASRFRAFSCRILAFMTRIIDRVARPPSLHGRPIGEHV